MYNFSPPCPKAIENKTAIEQNNTQLKLRLWREAEMHKQSQHCCKQNPEKFTQAVVEQMGRPYKKVHVKMEHLNKETTWEPFGKTANESISFFSLSLFLSLFPFLPPASLPPPPPPNTHT